MEKATAAAAGTGNRRNQDSIERPRRIPRKKKAPQGAFFVGGLRQVFTAATPLVGSASS